MQKNKASTSVPPVALVTGGSKGYGSGIATALRERGFEVYLTGRDANALAAKEADGFYPLVADATVPADWDRVFSKIIEGHGRLDVLVNNAGGGVKIAPTEEQTDEAITQAIGLNLTSAIYGCRRAAPIMRKQGSGTIVNISSICSRHSWPGWGIYGAAKAGLENFAKSLYLELRPHGVRVTTVVPSWGATGFNEAAAIDPFEREKFEKAIQPSDIGRMVADICELPAHLCVQETVLWPLIQEVSPL